jgi:hypothetical protein
MKLRKFIATTIREYLNEGPKSYKPPSSFADDTIFSVSYDVRGRKPSDTFNTMNITFNLYETSDDIKWVAIDRNDDKIIAAGYLNRIPTPKKKGERLYQEKAAGSAVSGFGVLSIILKYLNSKYHLLSDRVVSAPVRHVWKTIFSNNIQDIKSGEKYYQQGTWFVPKLGSNILYDELFK